MKIQSVDRDMAEILSSYFYRIPSFQRPYSWDTEEVDEFWTDVVVEGGNNYFIGSMVVFTYPDKLYGVVDGQQRLTTITIILCALRNSFRDEGFGNLAEALQQYIERTDVNANLQYILQTETSYPYFQEYIQKSTPPQLKLQPGEEERKLDASFKRISTYIKKSISELKANLTLEESERKELIRKDLIGIRDKILNLKVIFIDLDSEEEAFIAFETLNTRGKDLEIADLVKSYIFRFLKPSNINIDIAKEKWYEIVSNIESSDQKMNDFLHDYWVAQNAYVPPKKLYKSIKSDVNQDNADDFLDRLLEVSTIYRTLYDQSSRKWGNHELDIKRSLESLKAFRVRQHLPILIAIMLEYENKNLKKRKVAAILRKLENFHFIFTAVVSERANKARKEFYAKYARDLAAAQDGNKRNEIIREFEKELKSKLPSFEDFELNFLKIQYTSEYTKQKALVQYILAEIDRVNEKETGIILDYSQMTIEHLSPENPPECDPLINVGQVGNLILAESKFNSNQLANKNFAEKKELLSSSRIHLDEIILESTDWDESEIEKRTKYLAELAYNTIWKL